MHELVELQRICSSSEYKDGIEQTMRKLAGIPIVLYGAGAVGVEIAGVFKHYGLNVICFCDTYKRGVQMETGLPIIAPQTLAQNHLDAVVVISSIYFAEEIKANLDALGILAERIIANVFFNLHKLSPKDLEPHFAGYARSYEFFQDDKSKQILLERIKCYLTPSPIIASYLSSVVSPLCDQYFDADIVRLSSCEVFIDGGMYIGDTADQFLKRTSGQYRHYYGFEPDKANYSAAVKHLTGKRDATTIEKGLWSHETSLPFSASLGSSSALDSSGSETIAVTALDAYFSDKPPPTYIKMDIEGAELMALKGAENIIRSHKPKLAISAYHKPEDVYTLPMLIRSYRNDYKFYLRHYTNSLNETVLYAV